MRTFHRIKRLADQVRCEIAMFISAVFLPHSIWRWSYWQSAGLASASHTAYALGVFILVALLLFRKQPTYAYWRLAATSLAVAVLHTVIATRKVGDSIESTHVALLTLPWALLWCWLAWSPAIPHRRRHGYACLMLALLGAPACLCLRVEGFEGNGRLSLFWHDLSSTTDKAPKGLSPVPVSREYSQFLGMHRDAVVTDITLADDWEQNPIQEIWRQDVGAGWGAFVVREGIAYTLERRELEECVVAYRITDGKEIWVSGHTSDFSGSAGGNGSRSTPVVVDDHVIALGVSGILRCLDRYRGEEVWSRDILNGRENLEHGITSSPLVVNEKIFVCPTGENGPCLDAVHVQTGEVLWETGTCRASYSSPMFAVLQNVPQILLFDSEGLGGYELTAGRELWHYPWTNSSSVNAAQPVLFADEQRVFITCAFGQGSAMIEISCGGEDHWSTKTTWTSSRMQGKFSTPVRWRDAIVGLDNGILAAIGVNSGKLLWKSGRYGHGQVLRVGVHLLVLSEKGELVFLKLEPGKKQPKVLERRMVLSGKTWNHAAFAAPYLLLRNSREAACFQLPLAAEGPDSHVP